jgi:hypothetical protein
MEPYVHIPPSTTVDQLQAIYNVLLSNLNEKIELARKFSIEKDSRKESPQKKRTVSPSSSVKIDFFSIIILILLQIAKGLTEESVTSQDLFQSAKK